MRTLNNGFTIPSLCCGTTGIPEEAGYINVAYVVKSLFDKNKRNCIKERYILDKIIKTAMKNGCNMFDTSRSYHSAEIILGQTLKKYDRDKYIIVDKLSNVGQYNGDIRRAAEASLKRMALDYFDVYLFHWPVDEIYLKTWKEMEKLYEEGLCKAIGVCNCKIHHLEKLSTVANIKPMINQIECHPLYTRRDIREYCNSENIQIMAYTATARMDSRMNITCIKDIAERHNKSMSQVIIKWHQQIGNVPIFYTKNVDHMVQNTKMGGWKLTDDEIQSIDEVNINSILRFDSDNCDFRKL